MKCLTNGTIYIERMDDVLYVLNVLSWSRCWPLFYFVSWVSRPAWIEVRNWEVKTGGIVRTFALDGCAGRVVEPNLITSTVSGLTEQGPWPWIGYLLTKGSDRSSTFVIHRSNVYLGSSNRRLYDFHLQLYTWFPHGNAPSFVLDCHCVINTSFGMLTTNLKYDCSWSAQGYLVIARVWCGWMTRDWALVS